MKLHLRQKRFLWGALLVFIALLLVSAYLVFMPVPQSAVTLPTTTLTIGKNVIEVELAVTEAQRELGLSGRASLSPGKGMFFIFQSADQWGIWMKDMHFPIDIVWIDVNGVIVTIERNVSPDTYPARAFYPNVPAAYVLEVPAGYTKAHGIAVGGKIVVK